MIKKNIPAWLLIGKKVKVERDICNGAGNVDIIIKAISMVNFIKIN